MRELTAKEEKFLELFEEGQDKITALKGAGFNFTNDQSARVYANRLLHKPKIIERLRAIRDKVDDKLADRNIKFIDLLLKYVSMDEIAQILARNLKSKELRVSDSALEKVMRVISAFPKEELQSLDGSNFQLVFVKGKEDVKTLEGKSEDLPMLIQRSAEENGEEKIN